MLTYLENSNQDAAPLLVCLHAFPLDGRMFAPQLEEFRALALHLPGFGDSDFDAGATVELMADAVAATLESREARDVVLCGVSLGGYVALAFARKYPDRLRALVLADTRAEADTPEARAKRDENIAFVRKAGSAAFTDKMLPALLGETTRREWPQVVETARRIGSAQQVEAIVAGLQALRDRPDATPHLPHIAVPTLVLRGEEDAVTPLSAMQNMTAAISGARFESVPRAGHLSNLENPAAFNMRLRSLLASLND